MSKHRMLLLITVYVLVQLAFSQNEGATGSGPLTSVADKLKQHNIPTTKKALVEALRNPDSEIRGLAALQLAESDVRSAIPDMVSAIAKETAPRARINIASALSQLGEQKGFDVLRDTCKDADLPGYLRTRAASYLLNVNDSSCLGAVLTILQNDADADSLIAALGLLPRFTNVSQADSRTMYALNVKALANSTPAVRLVASHTLVALGPGPALQDLARAVAAERDEHVRAWMEEDLQRLQEKKDH
ncbi:MAG: hypothetical protein DMG61_11690 [Acidobacteria bacterium]|nr:MAG: hypothetical protein DMG61_11690 [Acidobacteriota bacterium]PYY19300.1 MAG: hypothetical protein DMG60_04830 [Acidobacteriota bacterium]